MDVRNLGLSDDDLEALGYKVSRKGEVSGRTGAGHSPQGAAPAARGDGAARAWFWTLAILVGVGWFAHPAQRMPHPVAANQPDTVFSSGRAMSQLVEIARAPRPPGSPEHERVRSLLATRLSELDMEVEVRSEDVLEVDSAVATLATVHDVVARRPGSDPTGTLLLYAHYDGVPVSWGAADDGIGLAAILETLRATLGQPPLRNDLMVVLGDGDEIGVRATDRILREGSAPAAPTVLLAIDPVGVAGPARLMEGPDGGGRLLAHVEGELPAPVVTSALRTLAPAVFEEDPPGPLLAPGHPTLLLTSLHGRDSHHAATDRPIQVEEAALQHHGAQLLAMTRSFGGGSLGDLTAAGDEPRMYVTLPWIGIVDAPRSRAMIQSLALVLLLGIVLLVFRVRGGSLKRAAAGVVTGATVVALSAGAARGLTTALGRFHPELGRVDGLVYDGGIHLLVLVALVVALTTASYGVARLRFSRREVVLGALVVPLAALVWLTLTAPDAVAGAQWAVGLALAGALPLALLTEHHTPGRWLRLLLLASSSALLLVLVPELELAGTALTLEEAPLVAALLAVGAMLLFPVLEWLRRPRAWWTPALATAVAAGALFWATPGVQGDAAHPVPTSLILLVDDTVAVPTTVSAGPVLADRPTAPAGTVTSGAPVATAEPTPAARDLPDDARWMPGRWLTVPGPGEEWAMSWVVGQEDRGSDPGELLLPAGIGWTVAGTGPEARLAPPSVRVTGSSAEADERTLELRVEPGLDAEMFALRVADGSPGVLVSVNGEALPQAPGAVPVRTLIRWGDSGPVAVGLVSAADASVTLELIEHHMRPARILGGDFFQREDSVMADASTGSDRIIQRTRLELGTDAPSR